MLADDMPGTFGDTEKKESSAIGRLSRSRPGGRGSDTHATDLSPDMESTSDTTHTDDHSPHPALAPLTPSRH